MVQASQTPVIWTVIIATIVLLVAGFFVYTAIPTADDVVGKIDIPTQDEIANSILSRIVFPTAADIAANVKLPDITIPDFEDVNNEKLNRVCELTEGCEYYEGSISDLSALDNSEAEDDFFDAMVDFTNIDEDNLVIQSNSQIYNNLDRDDERIFVYQIRAYTEDDKDDENWEIKTFIKVRYYDSDDANDFNDDDAEYAYLVVTSILDEGEYDSLSIEEVSRNFEFD